MSYKKISPLISNSVLKKILIIAIIISVLLVPQKSSISPVYNPETDYIKWFDFSATAKALNYCAKLDIDSLGSDVKVNWIDLLAVLACRYGGDFKNYKNSHADEIYKKLSEGLSAYEASGKNKNFAYYYDGYYAVLGGMLGYFKTNVSGEFQTKYGIKAFSPIAEGYLFTHYRDFGASRSYGFKRSHLGNDLLGSIGTPIAAVESGIVEAIGWNTYGGWRIGIRSADSNRYYYYAHLRKDKPYADGLKVGDIVTAGDIIGYLGMTGYSTKENTNNINIPHLHFGMQLIFDESQKDANAQIWIDVYEIIEFLKPYSVTVKKDDNGDFKRLYQMIDPAVYD